MSKSIKSTKSLTGMKKREQIDAAQRTVFIWAVIAAVALSLALVVGYFLVKEIALNQRIYSEKGATERTLDHNLQAASELEKNVKSLIANGDLAKAKDDENDTTYQVVLDALPVTGDSTVLGSGLLQRILPPSGVSVESLSSDASAISAMPVDPMTGDVTDDSSGSGVVTPIPFTLKVQGDYNEIKSMFTDIERSIRPINVRFVTIEALANELSVTIQGESYYSSKKTIELSEKQV